MTGLWVYSAALRVFRRERGEAKGNTRFRQTASIHRPIYSSPAERSSEVSCSYYLAAKYRNKFEIISQRIAGFLCCVYTGWARPALPISSRASLVGYNTTLSASAQPSRSAGGYSLLWNFPLRWTFYCAQSRNDLIYFSPIHTILLIPWVLLMGSISVSFF